MNETHCTLITISLKFVPKDLTDNKTALVHIMAWCHQATNHCLNKCSPCSSTAYAATRPHWVNTWRPRQNGRYVADDIFKCILLNENVWIPNIISLKFVAKGPINNILSLVQIMAWRRPGDKPLSEPMMLSSLTHICVTRPQWVKCVVLYTHCIVYCATRQMSRKKANFHKSIPWRSYYITILFLFTFAHKYTVSI